MPTPLVSGRIPGYQAERLFDTMLRFRKAWPRYHRRDDLRHLLSLFPHLSLESGFELDYLQLGPAASSWIWPFARRVSTEDKEIPDPLATMARDRLAGARGSDALRKVEVETLYRFFSYEPSSVGLFEYAVFITEMWATKSMAKAKEWLDLEPIFNRRAFDGVVRRVSREIRPGRPPDSYDPLARLSSQGGGEVTFMAYEPGAWKRIVMLRLLVAPDGVVRREAGQLVLSLR